MNFTEVTVFEDLLPWMGQMVESYYNDSPKKVSRERLWKAALRGIDKAKMDWQFRSPDFLLFAKMVIRRQLYQTRRLNESNQLGQEGEHE